ncbi:MAG: methionyl-tRNA formyltransferase, partial [Bacteroidota bacterium]
MSKDLKIVFMGTPHFAVTCLKTLVEEELNIVAVITAVDKPAGRGKKLKASPVKEYALEQGLRVLQPSNLKSPDFIDELKQLEVDLFVVVAFRMLPEVVWAMPPMGTINLHASLLPNYRGAAPINWAIINGEKETGVTTFFIEKEIDTGKIIHQDRVRILEEMTAGELHDELALVGSRLLCKTITAIAKEEAESYVQAYDSEHMKKAPKIFKEDCRINWDSMGLDIHNFIRGLSPFPSAWTQLDDEKASLLKIARATFIEERHEERPGSIRISKRTFEVACKDGWISILELIPQGKGKMNVQAFLNG